MVSTNLFAARVRQNNFRETAYPQLARAFARLALRGTLYIAVVLARTDSDCPTQSMSNPIEVYYDAFEIVLKQLLTMGHTWRILRLSFATLALPLASFGLLVIFLLQVFGRCG